MRQRAMHSCFGCSGGITQINPGVRREQRTGVFGHMSILVFSGWTGGQNAVLASVSRFIQHRYSRNKLY